MANNAALNQKRNQGNPLLEFSAPLLELCTIIGSERDFAIEIFLENGKMRTPYKRGIGWEPTTFARWQHPNCTPGIGSKVYIDDPIDESALAAYLESSLKTSQVVDTYTRPYILVVYGNDQYISVYPNFEEIGPDHPHRQKVERHFQGRGLNFIEEITINWDTNEQGDNFDSFRFNTEQFGLSSTIGDANYFRNSILANFGVPPKLFIKETPICHQPEES